MKYCSLYLHQLKAEDLDRKVEGVRVTRKSCGMVDFLGLKKPQRGVVEAALAL
jgi:hypothetical protein